MIDVTPNFRVKTERQRRKREGDDPKHLDNLRKLRCCVCGCRPPVTVHHLKQGRMSQQKAEDRWGIPLCLFPHGDDCHGQIERIGSKKELAWLLQRGVDGLALAAALWSNKHSLEAMRRVAAAHDAWGDTDAKE